MTIEVNQQASDNMMLASNVEWCDPRVDPNLVRKPERFIHLFTVSKREFIIERPPLHPYLRVPACKPQERYKLVAHVPDPFTQAVRDDNGRLKGEAHSGIRVAIDLVNPNNITTNIDWECPDQYQGEVTTGYGCDLSRQGLFLSLNEVPLEAEIVKAEKKRHNYYDGLRRTAVLLESTNPKELALTVEQNKDYHLMADFFGLEFPWHKTMKVMVTCPNCQEKVSEGAAYHFVSGNKCILDWKKTVLAGMAKREDVPEELQWWADEKRSPARPKTA
jgi:hypothetical protein